MKIAKYGNGLSMEMVKYGMKNQENVWFQESMWFKENGHGAKKISFVAHGKSVPWLVGKKREYF